MFWQAYAGGIDLASVTRCYGGAARAAVRTGLVPLALNGLVHGEDGRWSLTPKGFDTYHDLERVVTYELIEPLWAEMLKEHQTPSAAADAARGAHADGPARAGWARPEHARRGRLWPVARRLFERPL